MLNRRGLLCGLNSRHKPAAVAAVGSFFLVAASSTAGHGLQQHATHQRRLFSNKSTHHDSPVAAALEKLARRREAALANNNRDEIASVSKGISNVLQQMEAEFDQRKREMFSVAPQASEIERLQKELAFATALLPEKEEQIKRLTERLEKQKLDAAAAGAAKDSELADVRSRLRTKERDLASACAKQAEDAQKAEETSLRAAALQKQIDELQAAAQRKAAEATTTGQRVAALTAEVASLSEQLKTAEAKISLLEEESAANGGGVSTLESELAATRLQLSTAQTELQTARTDEAKLRAAAEAMERQVARLMSESKAAEAKARGLEALNGEHSQKIEELEQRLASATDSLKVAEAKAEAARVAQVGQLRDDLTKERAEHHATSECLAERTEKVAALESQLASAEDLNGEHSRKIEELERRLASATDSLMVAETTAEAARVLGQLRDDLTKEQEHHATSECLAERTKEVAALKSQLAAAEDTAKDLSEEVHRLHSDKLQLETDLMAATQPTVARGDTETKEFTALKSQVESLESELQDNKKQRSLCESESTAANEMLANTRAALDAAVENRRNDLAAKEEEIRRLQDQLLSQQQQQAMTTTTNEAEAAIDHQTIAALKARASSLEEELCFLRNQLRIERVTAATANRKAAFVADDHAEFLAQDRTVTALTEEMRGCTNAFENRVKKLERQLMESNAAQAAAAKRRRCRYFLLAAAMASFYYCWRWSSTQCGAGRRWQQLAGAPASSATNEQPDTISFLHANHGEDGNRSLWHLRSGPNEKEAVLSFELSPDQGEPADSNDLPLGAKETPESHGAASVSEGFAKISSAVAAEASQVADIARRPMDAILGLDVSGPHGGAVVEGGQGGTRPAPQSDNALPRCRVEVEDTVVGGHPPNFLRRALTATSSGTWIALRAIRGLFVSEVDEDDEDDDDN